MDGFNHQLEGCTRISWGRFESPSSNEVFFVVWFWGPNAYKNKVFGSLGLENGHFDTPKSPMSCTVLVAPIFYLRGMTWIWLTFVHFVKLADVKRNKKNKSDSKPSYDFGVPPSHVTLWDQLTNRWQLKIDPDLNRCISLLKVRGYSDIPTKNRNSLVYQVR